MSEGNQNPNSGNDRSGQMPSQGMAVLEYQGNNPTRAPVPYEGPVQMSVPPPQDHNHPRTLQDVLRYSIAATPAGAHEHAPLSQMDNERRAFLEASLHAFSSSAVDRMTACIQVLLQDDIQQDQNACGDALEQIIDLVDNIDNAKDFHKIGGFRAISLGLHSRHNTIRALTANLVAELSQNNTYIQDQILETDFLTILLNMVASDPDPNVQIKSFYAVSCIVRDHEAALQTFSAQHGWSVLLKALQSSVEKLQLKACFLLSCVCSQTPTVVNELCDLGYVEQLCGLLAGVSQCPLVEHLLQALLSMASNSKQAVELCSLPQMQLRTTLSNLLETSEKDMDDYRYAQQIKTLVFGSNYEDDGER